MTCKDCKFFYPVAEGEFDYEQGKGDCVNALQDSKGKYWLVRKAKEDAPSCANFKPNLK